MKFVILICLLIAKFQNGYSELTDFGNFFGPCPNVKGIENTVLENSDEEWYTHRVVGRYLPWNYVTCLLHKFDFKSAESDKISTVKTQYALPYLPLSFEVEGPIQKIDEGEYQLNYKTRVFGSIPQKLVVLKSYYDGLIVRTCLDFWLFHFESLQVISKSKVPLESSNPGMLSRAENQLKYYGASSEEIVEINQSC